MLDSPGIFVKTNSNSHVFLEKPSLSSPEVPYAFAKIMINFLDKLLKNKMSMSSKSLLVLNWLPFRNCNHISKFKLGKENSKCARKFECLSKREFRFSIHIHRR